VTRSAVHKKSTFYAVVYLCLDSNYAALIMNLISFRCILLKGLYALNVSTYRIFWSLSEQNYLNIFLSLLRFGVKITRTEDVCFVEAARRYVRLVFCCFNLMNSKLIYFVCPQNIWTLLCCFEILVDNVSCNTCHFLTKRNVYILFNLIQTEFSHLSQSTWYIKNNLF